MLGAFVVVMPPLCVELRREKDEDLERRVRRREPMRPGRILFLATNGKI